MNRTTFWMMAVAGAVALAGCSGNVGGGKAFQTIQANGESIELATPTGELTDQQTDLTVTFKDASGQPIDVQSPSVKFFMPAMGAMAAMNAEVPLEPTGQPGTFKGSMDLEMKGTWQTTIAYRQGGQLEQATTSVQAQ